MDPMTLAMVGQGVGSIFGMFGANKAARAQEAASAEQLALMREQYNQGRADLQPYTQTGYNALNALGSIYGLPQVSYQPPPMQSAPGQPPGPSTVSGPSGGIPASAIAGAPEGYYRTTSEGGAVRFEPLPAGYQAPQAAPATGATAGGFFSGLGDLFSGIRSAANPASENPEWDRYGDQFTDNYVVTPENFNMVEDPGYRFRLKEQQDALEAASNARGTFFSGNALEALTRKSGEMASNEFGAAYGRARTGGLDRYAYDADQYGRKVGGFRNYLSGLSGLAAGGQNAAGGLGTMGMQFAQNGATALANRGDALAAGAVGATNALTGGINNALGLWSYYNKPGTA